MLRRWTCALILAEIFCVAPASARVPESAESRGLAMPPELLDSVAQVFEFPQLATDHFSQIVALSTENAHVGAIARPGDAGVFAFTEAEARQGYGFNVGREMQAGGAIRVGSVRGGVAVRGTHFLEERLDSQGAGEEEFVGWQRSNSTKWEASLGIGAEREIGFFDVAFDLGWDDMDGIEYVQAPGDTLFFSRAVNADETMGVALRVGGNVGDHDAVRLIGSYREAEYGFIDQFQGRDSTGAERTSQRTQEWIAGASWETAIHRFGLLLVTLRIRASAVRSRSRSTDSAPTRRKRTRWVLRSVGPWNMVSI